MEKKRVCSGGWNGGVFFCGYWDPDEHIPTGFALMAIISQIAIFGPSSPPVFSNLSNVINIKVLL